MKILAFHFAKALGFFAMSRWLTRRGLRIIGYHGVWLGEEHYGNFLNMSPDKFAQRMSFLARSNYTVLSLDAALTGLKNGNLPNGATVITIDDGWHSTYSHMLPVLEEQGLPATIYVTTYFAQRQYPVFDVVVRYTLDNAKVHLLDLAALGIAGGGKIQLSSAIDRANTANSIIAYGRDHLDGEGQLAFGARLGEAVGLDYGEIVRQKLFHLMTLEEIGDAVRRGHDIQLHTHRHRVSLDDPEDFAREIADNREILEPIAEKKLHHFCYPSGKYEKSLWPQLEALDITSATSNEPGFNFAGASLLALNRIMDGQEVQLMEFEAELCGFVELTRRLRCGLHRFIR